MAVITTKNILKRIGVKSAADEIRQMEEFPDASRAIREPEELGSVQECFERIKGLCAKTSEIARLADRGLELSK